HSALSPYRKLQTIRRLPQICGGLANSSAAHTTRCESPTKYQHALALSIPIQELFHHESNHDTGATSSSPAAGPVQSPARGSGTGSHRRAVLFSSTDRTDAIAACA